MNKKMIRNLIILGAVVALAIAAALVLPNIKPPEPQAAPTPETAPTRPINSAK